MVITKDQASRAELYLLEGEELKKLFPQLSALFEEMAVDMRRAISASTTVDGCILCGEPAMHKKFTTGFPNVMLEYAYCCRCFPFMANGKIMTGLRHPNCMIIYDHGRTSPPIS